VLTTLVDCERMSSSHCSLIQRLVVTSVLVRHIFDTWVIKLLDLSVKCFYAMYAFEYKNYFLHYF